MKNKMLLHNEKLDTGILVDVPFGTPELSVGTKVTAKIPDPDDKDKTEKYEVEGTVVGIQTTTQLDMKTGQVTTMTIYTLWCDDFSEEMGTVEALEEEILYFIPTTNEYSAEYYSTEEYEEDEVEEEVDVTPTSGKKVVTEADVMESQERAAGSIGGRYGGGVDI